MGNRDKTYYIFRENFILTPADTPDAMIGRTINQKQTDDLLALIPPGGADVYSVLPLDNSGLVIDAVMLDSSLNSLFINGEVPAGWKQIPMRQAAGMLSAGSMIEGFGESGRLLRAFHIGQWRRESKFCGVCGSVNRDDETEVARKCTVCGRIEYPRIAPAIITLITNEKDEALLAHNKKFTAKTYALIAGFNEAGENLEATVAREIREEVSIEVKDIKYICSQPWPFPNSLMLGFSARHCGGVIKCDGVEIGDAQWFSRENLPLLPQTGSVSRYLIELWLNRKL
ncbi:MAG: NAD(+) diphosphatase [Treponema sp.]|nr:NAD(+) diphosphatase [Treponema sp.]